jgi:hypothetical protein
VEKKSRQPCSWAIKELHEVEREILKAVDIPALRKMAMM